MKHQLLQRTSTIFLQAVIVAIGIGVFVFLLWEPHVEGVNANATSIVEIYFDDPFLAYAYAASIFFFVALYHAFMVLRAIRKNTIFSRDSVRALGTIKYCMLAFATLIIAAVAYLMIAVRGTDDIAGGVAMGLFATFISVVIGATAAAAERVLQGATERKSADAPLRDAR